MSMYRLTVITKDNSSLPQVKETIAQVDGAIVQETTHGERPFVYPIQKLTKGLYTSYVLAGEPSKIHTLDQAVRGVEGVLRSLFVTWEMPRASGTSQKSKESKERVPEKTDVETKISEPPKDVDKTTAKKTKKPEKPKRPKKAELESSEDRLKELDEKLAEILKS